jgi:hypothetical protein
VKGADWFWAATVPARVAPRMVVVVLNFMLRVCWCCGGDYVAVLLAG